MLLLFRMCDRKVYDVTNIKLNLIKNAFINVYYCNKLSVIKVFTLILFKSEF